ncbi:MAG: hypothetical protein NT133_02700 [Alphaproteobacteria bacterium]|nr:hypothetical protein [Alphaproteobacteria bacterium]
MNTMRADAALLQRKSRGNAIPPGGRRQVPGEGQDVPPMGVLMKQGADRCRIRGCKRRFERLEPILGRSTNPLSSLKFSEGVIFSESLIECVHVGSLCPASIQNARVWGSLEARFGREPARFASRSNINLKYG